MRALSLILILVMGSFISSFVNGAEFIYTENNSSGNNIALGYPVPIPVDSLTPVDGFRTYQSLDLRHQQLAMDSPYISREPIGATVQGRTIWAYQLSDPDGVTETGELEGSALINGGIHAREWQTPEALTGYMEGFFQHQADQHIYQYLLENSHLVLIPVLNIDGFLQTQRYPANVTNSEASPRDGRMRRKNMRNVDESLVTTSDNLNGIDLNRNSNPYWATNPDRSSDDLDSIVHHGASAASEPETKALQQAALLAGEERLRFYTDTHSFTQVYFAPMTNNSRRNSVTGRLATIMRAANDFKYAYGPSGAGAGIGSTDEYFANTYQIPSYTLELEPQNSAQDYGGIGVSHDGFILPNSEVARMRQETLNAAVAGLYAMTAQPSLTEAIFYENDQVVLHLSWQLQDDIRELNTLVNGELTAGTNYQLRLIFNKPMRAVTNGAISAYKNLSQDNGVSLAWQTKVAEQIQSTPIDTTNGQWLLTDFKRYQTDSYQVEVSLPEGFDWAGTQLLAIETTTTDMVGQALDTNPATIADWQGGSWQGYENSQGDFTDLGGVDKSLRLINDGSDLYPEPASEPTPTPEPTNTSKKKSGGSFGWGLLILFLVFSLRQVAILALVLKASLCRTSS